MSYRLLPYAFACLAAWPAAGQTPPTDPTSAALSMELEFHPQGQLGYGWDAVRNAPPAGRATCLDGVKHDKDLSPKENAFVRLVETKADVLDAFELSAEASFQGLVYKAGGSIAYAQSQSLSTDQLNLAGSIDAMTRTEYVKGAKEALTGTLSENGTGLRIKPDYLKLLTSGDPAKLAQFRRDCGDSFVTDIQRGGKLSIFLTVTTQSQTEKQSLRAKLSGGSATTNLSVAAAAEAIKNTTGSTVSGEFYAVGALMPQVDITSPDGMIALMGQFSQALKQGDAGRSMVVQSYWSLVPGQPGSFGIPEDAIKAARDYFALSAAWDKLDTVWNDLPSGAYDMSRAPSRTCLGQRKDELIAQAQHIPDQLKTCGTQLVSTLSGSCNLAHSPVTITTAAACPLAPNILSGAQHSAYDYLALLPPRAEKLPGACVVDATAKTRVFDDWVRPVWRAACADTPADPACASSFEDRATGAVPLTARPSLYPAKGFKGKYKDTCSACSVGFVSNGKMKLTCKCSHNGSKHSTSVTLSCPYTGPLENCKGRLKAGNSC